MQKQGASQKLDEATSEHTRSRHARKTWLKFVADLPACHTQFEDLGAPDVAMMGMAVSWHIAFDPVFILTFVSPSFALHTYTVQSIQIPSQWPGKLWSFETFPGVLVSFLGLAMVKEDRTGPWSPLVRDGGEYNSIRFNIYFITRSW
jgi:hypothetical protein